MITVIMSYYNRKELLNKTLLSMSQSKCKDFQVFIIDDGSDEDQKLDRNWLSKWDMMDITVLSIDPKDKNWFFEVVPMNVLLKHLPDDIDKILIQSPECAHLTDILDYANRTKLKDEWRVISTFGLDDTHGGKIVDDKLQFDFALDKKSGKWYAHPTERPKPFHFCVLTNKTILDTLGGFDERYAADCAYGDDDLVRRIHRAKVPIKWEKEQVAIHQYHTNMTYKASPGRGLKNEDLFHNLKNESVIDVSAFNTISDGVPFKKISNVLTRRRKGVHPNIT